MKIIQIITALSLLTSCEQVNTKTEEESKVRKTEEVEFTKLSLADTTIYFMWRDLKYDSTLNNSFSSIFLNLESLLSD